MAEASNLSREKPVFYRVYLLRSQTIRKNCAITDEVYGSSAGNLWPVRCGLSMNYGVTEKTYRSCICVVFCKPVNLTKRYHLARHGYYNYMYSILNRKPMTNKIQTRIDSLTANLFGQSEKYAIALTKHASFNDRKAIRNEKRHIECEIQLLREKLQSICRLQNGDADSSSWSA